MYAIFARDRADNGPGCAPSRVKMAHIPDIGICHIFFCLCLNQSLMP